MSDFLTRLAERTLATHPAIRPVVSTAQLYEPNADARSQSATEGETFVPSSRLVAPRQEQTPAPSPRLVAPRQEQTPGPSSRLVAPRQEQTPHAIVVEHLPATAAHAPADAVDSSVSQSPEPDQKMSRQELRRGESPVTQDRSQPALAPQTEAQASRPSTQSVQSVQVPQTPETSHHVIISPQARVATPTVPRQPEAYRRNVPEAPSVQVTIGRVEVRAIVPPPAPTQHAPERRPAAHMSLDAYLKGRNRGRG
jgi:hypothetical protein